MAVSLRLVLLMAAIIFLLTAEVDGGKKRRRRRKYKIQNIVTEELPSLEDILNLAIAEAAGRYTVTDTCSVNLIAKDECLIGIKSKPKACLTVPVLAEVLFESGSDAAEAIGSTVPDGVGISKITINMCEKTFEMTVTSEESYTIIPDVLSVSDVSITVSYESADKKIDFEVSGTWTLGTLQINLVAAKEDDVFTITGEVKPSGQIQIARLITSMGSTLNSGNVVGDAASTIGLDDIEISSVIFEAWKQGNKYISRFSFDALKQTLNARIYISLYKTDTNGLTIATSYKPVDYSIANFFDTFLDLDLSIIPFVDTTKFTSMYFIATTTDISEAELDYDDDGVNGLFPVDQGIKLVTDMTFSSTPCQVEVIISDHIQFNILTDAGVSFKTFIDQLTSSLGSPPVPPGFDLDAFLALTLTGFSYDPDTKVLTIPVELPDEIEIIPSAIVLENAVITFEVGGGTVSLEFDSIWRLGDLVLPLSISMPSGLQIFVAESNPDFSIPIGKLLEQFIVGILPSGELETAVSNAGFGDFIITDPTIKIYMGTDKVVKLIGTATIGDWECQVELSVGKISGQFVLATGAVLNGIPVTGILSILTGGSIDMSNIPGASILAETNVALALATANIPKSNKYMNFEIPALADISVIGGVSIVSEFKLPDSCSGDDVCEVFKNLLGPDIRLILKGTLQFTSGFKMSISALIPSEINIYNGIAIKDIGLEINVGASRNGIGITGTLEIPDPPLTFTGGFGISTSGVYLQMTMEGMWEKPFGVPFLAVGNIHIFASIVPDLGVLAAVEFGGTGQLGFLDRPGATPLEITMYCGIDRYTVSENYFYGNLSALTIPAVLAAFDYHPSLPDPFGQFGFPDGLEVSYAFRERSLPNGLIVPMGFQLIGRIKMMFFDAMANIRLSTSGIYVYLEVPNFSIGDDLVSVSGKDADSGPSILVDLTWSPPEALINIEASIEVLDINVYTNITIDESSTSFTLAGSFLNLFEASLSISTNHELTKNLDLSVSGYFKNDLIDLLNQEVQEAFTAYKNKADEEINNAKDDVDNAQASFDDAADAMRSANSELEKAQGTLSDANNVLASKQAVFDDAKAEWDKAVSAMESAQSDVNDAQASLDAANEELEEDKSSCPGCRKRRSIDDSFLNPSQAKRVLKNKIRKKRLIRVRVKSPEEIWEEAQETGREATCGTCRGLISAAQKTVDAASSTLDGVKATLSLATAAVEETKGVMDLASEALELAQGVVDLAIEGLNAAQDVVNAAATAVEEAQNVLDAAHWALDTAKELNKIGTMIGQALLGAALNTFMVIREIEFDVMLSAANTGRFSGSITANIMGSEETFSITINVKSIEDMVEELVEKMGSSLEDFLGLRRRKRNHHSDSIKDSPLLSELLHVHKRIKEDDELDSDADLDHLGSNENVIGVQKREHDAVDVDEDSGLDASDENLVKNRQMKDGAEKRGSKVEAEKASDGGLLKKRGMNDESEKVTEKQSFLDKLLAKLAKLI